MPKISKEYLEQEVVKYQQTIGVLAKRNELVENMYVQMNRLFGDSLSILKTLDESQTEEIVDIAKVALQFTFKK